MNTNPENDRAARSQGGQGQTGQPGYTSQGGQPRPQGRSASPSQQAQRAQGVQQAQRGRQVFAGGELRPPDHPLDFGAPEGLVDSTQRTYLIVLMGLLVVALVLFFIFGMGLASPIFFILALSLLAGWLVF